MAAGTHTQIRRKDPALKGRLRLETEKRLEGMTHNLVNPLLWQERLTRCLLTP
jgi:hypothetical protein